MPGGKRYNHRQHAANTKGTNAAATAFSFPHYRILTYRFLPLKSTADNYIRVGWNWGWGGGSGWRRQDWAGVATDRHVAAGAAGTSLAISLEHHTVAPIALGSEEVVVGDFQTLLAQLLRAFSL